MNGIVSVLTQNILPIFIVAGFGFLLQRYVGIEKRPLSTAVLYIFSPCLVFSSLVNSQLPGDELGRLALFTIINIGVMGVIGWVTAVVMRLERSQVVAILIVVMFVNGGNYGLTLNNLRYGEAGLSRAIVYYTTSTIVTYTFGLWLASMGQLSWREGGKRLLKLPPLYAAIAAIVVYSTGLTVPVPLMRGIEVAAAGAIPVLLLLLGVQLATLQETAVFRLALPAVGVRLLLGPLVGLGVATLIGLDGLGRSTSIIEASTPTAVMTIVLATEFDLQPDLVTTVVILTTLLSPITMATVITLFGL